MSIRELEDFLWLQLDGLFLIKGKDAKSGRESRINLINVTVAGRKRKWGERRFLGSLVLRVREEKQN